jgi:hypothetical protein
MASDEAVWVTSDRLLRWLAPRDWMAWGGVVGPAVFVADWAVLGAVRPGYSPVNEAISRLAEVGTTTRPEMTGGFVVYGAGLITYGLARRQRRPGRAWAWAVATGVATLGVAAFPLGRPLSEAAHAVFAVAGYATLAALPIAGPGRDNYRRIAPGQCPWRTGSRSDPTAGIDGGRRLGRPQRGGDAAQRLSLMSPGRQCSSKPPEELPHVPGQ